MIGKLSGRRITIPDVNVPPMPALATPGVIHNDWAKEKAVVELLATAGNRLDAVVQCGTNMSMISVSEKLKPLIGIPILAINAAIFRYGLRKNGFEASLGGGGRLLRDF